VVDFAAQGLLDGLEGEAREARERLLTELHDEGVPLEELRTAVEEDRLALLPVERVLAVETPYSARDLSENTGVDIDTLRTVRAAFGLPITDDDAKVYGEADLEVTKNLKVVLDTGVPVERITELNRVIGRAMLQVAAASRTVVGETMFRPGMTEYELAEAPPRPRASSRRGWAPRSSTSTRGTCAGCCAPTSSAPPTSRPAAPPARGR
jgi:adenylate cyclase